MKFHGVKRWVHSTFESGQPRLCALTMMISTCPLMDAVSTNKQQTLFDVIGFNARHMSVIEDQHKNRRVVIDGTMLGTRGVLEGIYSASVLDSRDAAWTELPLDHSERCAPRMYLHKNCVPRVPRMSFNHKDVVHYSFP